MKRDVKDYDKTIKKERFGLNRKESGGTTEVDKTDGNKLIVVCSSTNSRGIHQYATRLSGLVGSRTGLFCPWSGSYVLWEQIWIVRHFLKIRKAKLVVFANTRVSPLLWPLIRWSNVAVVVHDLMDTIADSSLKKTCLDTRLSAFGFTRVAINTALIKASISNARVLITNSKKTARELQRYYKPKRTQQIVVINPMKSFTFEEIKTAAVYARKAKGRTVKMLAVAGSSRNKAIDDYMHLMKSIVNSGIEGEGIQLVIVGIDRFALDNEARQIFEEMCERIVLVKGIGNTELARLYLESDIFVSTSIDEGYGMPIADSLSFGLDVVARDIEVYREIKVDFGSPKEFSLEKDLNRIKDSIIFKAVQIRGRSRDRIDNEEIQKRVERYAASIETKSRDTLELISHVAELVSIRGGTR